MDNTKESILRQMPEQYRMALSRVSFEGLEEIRFRSSQPVCLYYNAKTQYLSPAGAVGNPKIALCTGAKDIEAIATCLCNHSIYACLDDLKEGFVTIVGGHRAGFSGKCVLKNNQITGLSAISGINLRIAREHKGCAESLAKRLRHFGAIPNTLMVSPPQCGKTTFLRDLARIYSAEYKITVVDERSEIAGMCNGTPKFDIGIQTDVLDHFPKAEGMLLAVRSLSPQLLFTDELSDDSDTDAIRMLYGAGCRLIATLHGSSLGELRKTKGTLLSFFDVAVLMGRQNGIPAVIAIESLR